MKLYSMNNGASPMKLPGGEAVLSINTASPLISKLSDKCESDPAIAERIAKQIYSLCLLSRRKLESNELLGLLDESFEILELL